MFTARFEDAFRYAHVVHAHQVRKNTAIPYVAHLLDVTAIVLTYGGEEDEAIGALLHDGAEDAGGRRRLDDIRARFGPAVVEIVEGCTDSFEWPKPPWVPRKRDYVARIATESRSIALVSAADKLANARAHVADLRRPEIGEGVFRRFTASKSDTLWYYHALAAAFRARQEIAIEPLVAELERTVAELQRAAKMDGELPEPPSGRRSGV